MENMNDFCSEHVLAALHKIVRVCLRGEQRVGARAPNRKPKPSSAQTAHQNLVTGDTDTAENCPLCSDISCRFCVTL